MVKGSMGRAASNVVKDAFHWWSSEMAVMLPSSIRQHVYHSSHLYLIDFLGNKVVVTECRAGNAKAVEHYELGQGEGETSTAPQFLRNDPELRNAEFVIRIPVEQALTKMITLPVEAEGNILDVLGYEMDRQTPFSRDQVYFDYQVVGKASGGESLSVWMVLVPRVLQDEILKQVRAWGIAPSAVTIYDASAATRSQCEYSPINLLPSELRPMGAGAWGFFNRGLAISAAVLALAAVSLPFYLQQTAIDGLETRLAVIKKEADAALSLQQSLDQLIEEAQLVIDKKRQEPAAIDVIRELGLRLPDDTWLQNLQLREGRLEIKGLSNDASALIALLEDSPMFENAKFHSPIVRDPRYGRYRFDIVAEVRFKG